MDKSTETILIAQLKAYKELHHPTVNKFYDVCALTRSALSLLDQIETQNDIADDLNAARRILFILETMADKASDEIDESFSAVARGNHD